MGLSRSLGVAASGIYILTDMICGFIVRDATRLIHYIRKDDAIQVRLSCGSCISIPLNQE